MKKRKLIILLILGMCLGGFSSCGEGVTEPTALPTEATKPSPGSATNTPGASEGHTPVPSEQVRPSATAAPSVTATATLTPAPTASPTPTLALDPDKEYVWYACYGSNNSYTRFMKYINGCTDKTKPVASRSFVLPYSIYFASTSKGWNNKAVSFLDDSCPGMALGRIYLITSEQYEEVKKMEGSRYTKKLSFGEVDGFPVYSFTAPEKRTDTGFPDITYIDTILTGLIETYTDKTELELGVYLYSCGIVTEEDLRILSYIRKSSSSVSLDEIAKNTVSLDRVKTAIAKLSSYGFVKQDSKNKNQGYAITDAKALVSTNKEKRALIDGLIEKNLQ